LSGLLRILWVHRERCLVLVLLSLSITSLYLPRETGFPLFRRINRTVVAPFQVFIDRIELYQGAVRRSSELEEENIRLSLALHAMRTIGEENLRLRSLLNFSTQSGVRFVAARVIGYNPSGPLSSLVIDKGRKDGLNPLLPVLTPKGLVGKIVEADPGVSVVELFSANGFSVSGLVVGRGEVGIVTTRGMGRLFLEGLNLRTEVAPGDRVVSSGYGGVFPVGIPIGVIASVELDPLGVHRVAEVVPVVRLEEVREVVVLSDTAYVRADPLWLTRSRGSLASLWENFTTVEPAPSGAEIGHQSADRDGE
jgi:rod shape-determining protein MreC